MKCSKKDANHNPIVRRFRDLGCTVMETVNTGIPGFPDLVVGAVGQNHLVELKNPDSAYGRRGLNDNQTAFARDWRGERIYTVSSEDEVVAVVQNWRRA